jgi:hypothetical protein
MAITSNRRHTPRRNLDLAEAAYIKTIFDFDWQW